ncbi:hypothetical protein B0H10DRAFT_1950087 [Mycena sp. CBHHK59/15]|nr:hypothetical protein B0H10DRAFT_1950087 [Mycena sp. CBHHK59/15]
MAIEIIAKLCGAIDMVNPNSILGLSSHQRSMEHTSRPCGLASHWKLQAEGLVTLGTGGVIAYAKQKAATYEKQMQEGQKLTIATGYEVLLAAEANLITFVDDERTKEEKNVQDTVFMDDE